MSQTDYPITRRLVSHIHETYASFLGQPGLIRKVSDFNDRVIRDFSKVLGLKASLRQKSNRLLLTSDAYKADRDKGLIDSQIANRYRTTSSDQLRKLSALYDKATKAEARQEVREPVNQQVEDEAHFAKVLRLVSTG